MHMTKLRIGPRRILVLVAILSIPIVGYVARSVYANVASPRCNTQRAGKAHDCRHDLDFYQANWKTRGWSLFCKGRVMEQCTKTQAVTVHAHPLNVTYKTTCGPADGKNQSTWQCIDDEPNRICCYMCVCKWNKEKKICEEVDDDNPPTFVDASVKENQDCTAPPPPEG
jgi:hypothetical protein